MFRSTSKNDARSLGKLSQAEVKTVVDEYQAIYDAGEDERKGKYSSLVNNYYDLATDFYEFGWGQYFHFAPRRRGERLKDSMIRHQHFLADRLALEPGMQVVDLGCGVGGPARNIARHSGASIVGLNINAYQVERAKLQAKRAKEVGSLCRFIEGSFMQIPEKDDHFNAAYAIEATVHAPNTTDLYREIFRVLRPGACYAAYEWCLTDQFDAGNAEHQRIKNEIMIGDGLPDVPSTSEVDAALQSAGFELLDAFDRAHESDPQTPWYLPLQRWDFSLSSIPHSPWGRALINLILRAGEAVRMFPKGFHATSTLLNRSADGLVEGGRTGTFTPMYFVLARKPLRSGD